MGVRIGFVGAGGIATGRHLFNLQQIDEAEVVALCDVDAEQCKIAEQRVNGRLESLQLPGQAPPRLLSARHFTDVREMLSAEALDAAFIAVPPFAHGEIERELIEAGVHFFVEKPVSLSMDLAREIEAAISDKGLICAVGYQGRYTDAVVKAKEILEDEMVGMIMGFYLANMPLTPWWRVQEQSGGQLVEQSTHTLDLMRFLVGEVSTVYSIGATRVLGDTVPDFDIFDVGTVAITFASGAIGSLNSTCLLEFTGYEGIAEFMGVHVVARDLFMSVWKDAPTRINRPGKYEEVKIGNDYNLDMDRAFVEAVRTGDDSDIRSQYGDAVKTLEVTLAAERSARSGEVIHLSAN